MADTEIQWCDSVWNPVTGCTKVSAGCKNCYAEGVANRFWKDQYPQTVLMQTVAQPGGRSGEQYAGQRPRIFTDVRTHDDRLDQPLRWKKPRKVFVNSMSDLFHEEVPDAFIDRVFAVMALAPQHTFQILTKRAERMRWYMSHLLADVVDGAAQRDHGRSVAFRLPLPNVWLGVSVENQHFADERIPLLLQTPAAVRFLSCEPLLGPINFRWAPWDNHAPHPRRAEQLPAVQRDGRELAGSVNDLDGLRMLDWVIVGGESGPGARPFDLAWARLIVTQCQAAGVPVFVKQMGSNPWDRSGNVGFAPGVAELRFNIRRTLRDRKGGDPDEWPEDLRVRQFPQEGREVVNG